MCWLKRCHFIHILNIRLYVFKPPYVFSKIKNSKASHVKFLKHLENRIS